MTEIKHKFDTIQAIADELKIKRQTLYNRAKKTGVDISKKSFSDEEWNSLVNNTSLTNDNKNIDNDLTKIDMLQAEIDKLQHENEWKQNIIDVMLENHATQIKEKDKQIDQAQKLQAIAEQRLNEEHTQLIELKDSTNKSSWWKFWSK